MEAAINWIVEHENDPDIDNMPMVNKLSLSVFHAFACLRDGKHRKVEYI